MWCVNKSTTREVPQDVCWWVGLCSQPVDCLAWGIQLQEPAGFLGTATCWCWRKQDVCLHKSSSSWLLEISTISVHVVRVSHSHTIYPQETLQDQLVDFTQAPMKSLPLPWVLVHVRPCVCPPRMKFMLPPIAPVVRWSSCSQALLAFKAKFLEASSPDVRLWGWGVW